MSHPEGEPITEPIAAPEHRAHCEHCEAHATRINELEGQIQALTPNPIVDDSGTGDSNPDSKPVGVPWTHKSF